MTLHKFVSFYKRKEAKILQGKSKTINISLEPFYRHDLTTAFDLAFQSLKAHSTAILRVLSFMDPGDIPLQIFGLKDPYRASDDLAFCDEEVE